MTAYVKAVAGLRLDDTDYAGAARPRRGPLTAAVPVRRRRRARQPFTLLVRHLDEQHPAGPSRDRRRASHRRTPPPPPLRGTTGNVVPRHPLPAGARDAGECSPAQRERSLLGGVVPRLRGNGGGGGALCPAAPYRDVTAVTSRSLIRQQVAERPYHRSRRPTGLASTPAPREHGAGEAPVPREDRHPGRPTFSLPPLPPQQGPRLPQKQVAQATVWSRSAREAPK